MPEKINGNTVKHKIRSLSDLDELVGEHVTGEVPSTYWEDSHAIFRFDSEEEARAAIESAYFQMFLPDVDWSKTEVIKVKTYRKYSSDLASAWEVVEKLGADAKGLRLSKDCGRWVAEFDGAPNAVARNASIAICVAALRAKGIGVDIDPDMIVLSAPGSG